MSDITKEEARALLAPVRSYTDAEHEAAWRRFCANRLFDDLYELVFKVDKNELEAREAIRKLKDILFPDRDMEETPGFVFEGNDSWFSQPEASEGVTHEQARAHFRKEAESGSHAGDCTSLPCSCERCYVDAFYGVRTDKNWPVSGWKLIEAAAWSSGRDD